MHYRLFGLVVESPWELPLHPATWEFPEVQLAIGSVPVSGDLLWRASDPAFPFTCFRTPAGYALVWPEAAFHVTSETVTIDTTDQDIAIPLLLQPVWSVVLMLRGIVPLHGSAVARNGRAIAVLGASGSGKSTAALGLVARGWDLVADDLIALDHNQRLAPAPPFIRMARTGMEATDPDAKERVPVAVVAGPASLSAAIVLTDDHLTCERLRGSIAAQALLAHLYNPIRLGTGERRSALAAAAAIAGRVPVLAAPPRTLGPSAIEALVEEACT